MIELEDNIAPDRNDKGQFLPGIRYSPITEFKKGYHWRQVQPYWEKAWLIDQYIDKKKSAYQIAQENGCNRRTILYFLKKNGLIVRKPVEASKNAIESGRLILNHEWKPRPKYGKENGMYGKIGELNPNWRGGVTPERQMFYLSTEWAIACREVWLRDKAECQRCCVRRDKEIPLHVHHIISFMVKETRAKVSNLVLLCEPCHRFVHSKNNINSEFIIPYQCLEA